MVVLSMVFNSLGSSFISFLASVLSLSLAITLILFVLKHLISNI